MTNLPVPNPRTAVAGEFETAAYFNMFRDAVNFLANKPMAEVYQAASQSIPNGAFTAITMDSTILDTNGQHSNTTNNSRFTCQVAGWYSVSGGIGFLTNATGARGAVIYKNGAALSQSTGTITAASPAIHVATAGDFLVQLAVGDYVELFGFQSSGGALGTAGSGYYPYLYVRWDHA
ncbi:MAG: hypothetical protein HOY79_20700 [Streptomyces sp.]|nr:hypothetical protein [Streptomyces sp.]